MNECPIGNSSDVTSRLSLECVSGLFGGAIHLIKPGERYRTPLFTISTPAEPRQLTAIYAPQKGDESEFVELHIDPVALNQYRSVPAFQVGVTKVRRGPPVISDPNDDRVNYTWERDGWWYTLNVRSKATADDDLAESLVRQLIEES